MKIKLIENANPESLDHEFFCPACGINHGFKIYGSENNRWTWDRKVEHPTIRPSIKTKFYHEDLKRKMTCHLFITDGKIEYLSDCTHTMAGTVVNMKDI